MTAVAVVTAAGTKVGDPTLRGTPERSWSVAHDRIPSDPCGARGKSHVVAIAEPVLLNRLRFRPSERAAR
ncbi:hypothetical protein JCM9533A_07500 [Catenuloplanes niger JCM 9533]